MRVKIISLIKRQEEALQSLEDEYLKRIRRHLPCDLVEIRRAPIRDDGEREKIVRAEMKKLEPHLRNQPAVVALDSAGREYRSEEFSRWLGERSREGVKELVFLIGGPLGLSEELVNQARWKLSLSKMTFPHKLVRVILLEALYRSLEIERGGRYHK
jgi:23S rRNA (pseudouridine1915-N3)-methyltransferase